MKVHDFKTSLERGKAGESFLDQHFSTWFDIQPVSLDTEKQQGIDRRFTPKDGSQPFTVEYKTDYRAFETGNAFIETLSIDTNGASGWAAKSQADMLAYYLPNGGLIYWLEMASVRRMLPEWSKRYPIRSAQNATYKTYGLLVPLAEFEQYALQVINL